MTRIIRGSLCTFSLFIFSSLMSVAFSAEVYTGNLYLDSQEQVNAFRYSEVTGSLSIKGVDIVDLSPLKILTSVGSYLSISGNETLKSVEGFESLVSIGSGLYIYENPLLENFSGFNALVSTGDNIDFWYNNSLKAVSGFDSLVTAGWSLEFGGNPNLVALPDFKSLKTIKSSLYILDNTSLAEISGFNALDYVDWSFSISGNSSLTTVCGLYNYANLNNPYTGGGVFDISSNHVELADSSETQSIVDGGACVSSNPPGTPPSISELLASVDALDLPNRDQKSLIRLLKSADRALSKGEVQKAKDLLSELILKIESLSSDGTLDPAVALELINALKIFMDSL